MRILIIESEATAARRLEKLLSDIAPGSEIAGLCKSAKEATLWLKENALPDLVISAVQLSDGLSFDVLKKLNNKRPVIITCTNEKYAVDTYKVNAIDYLIKPVKKEDLREALDRCRSSLKNTGAAVDIHPYQERFIVHIGKQMKLIQATDIAYFFTENKIVYLRTAGGEKFTTDYTLDQLEKLVDPKTFFRINRQFMVNISSIVKMTPATKSRLALTLRPETKYETITSNVRTAGFRKWVTGLS